LVVDEDNGTVVFGDKPAIGVRQDVGHDEFSFLSSHIPDGIQTAGVQTAELALIEE